MDSSLILSNILNSPVLFFFIGITTVFFKSDLEISQAIPKLFSLCLLLALGVTDSHKLNEMSLGLKLDRYNAVAIAATYGSISAVTCVTASTFLARVNIEFGGPMVAALAWMASPVIIVGLLLVNIFANNSCNASESKSLKAHSPGPHLFVCGPMYKMKHSAQNIQCPKFLGHSHQDSATPSV